MKQSTETSNSPAETSVISPTPVESRRAIAMLDVPGAGHFTHGGGVGQATPQPDFWQRVFRQALRGRYSLAVVLGVIVGSVCGVIGWRLGNNLYQSEGLIRIAYTKPAVIRESDLNRPIAMYDAFMRSQQLLITSRRIVEMALRSETWQATGRGDSPAVMEMFARELAVEQPKGTEVLRITFTDPDPNVTAAAVNSIIHAYEADYKDLDGGMQQKRIRLLTELEAEQNHSLADLTKRLGALNGSATIDVEQLHAAAVQRLAQYESKLADVELGLALSQSRTPSETSNMSKMMTPRQIAMIDSTMRDLLSVQTRLENDLSQVELRLGENHPTVRGLKQQIRQAKEQVAQYADEFREYQSQHAQSPDVARQGPMSVFVQPAEVLQANREVLVRIVEQARQEVATLGSKRDEAEVLKSLVYKTRQSLGEVQDRKDMLSLEMQLGDRLEITSLGQVPLSTFRDTRWRIAAVGAVLGGTFPAAVLALFGLVYYRYRYSDEARKMAGERKLPLLGVLPMLQSRRLTQESASDAAQCVHQIRVMLQGGDVLGPRAYLVSSASPQEGKTSLCLALGLSFTASGARTLVIDADLVGKGLTRGLRAEGVPGFREALRTGRLSATERPDGLSVLTAGDSDAAEISKISSNAIRRLLDEARKHFDTILIDSGPILGSVEATVTAREVDGVIVTIARGQEPSLVERALQHLDALGATVVGAVFNRARIHDFYRSFRSSSGNGRGLREQRERMRDFTPFGPLVDSVVLSAGSSGG